MKKEELLDKFERIKLTLCGFNQEKWDKWYEQAYRQIVGIIKKSGK